MDPMTRILIRLSQWLRRPPSRRQAIAIVLVERHVGWPDWAQSERVPIRRM